MTTFKEATDDISTLFFDAATPTGYAIFWENVRDQREPSQEPWFQLVIRHAAGRQTSLGGDGNRTFDRLGVAIVSIFIPIGKGLSDSYDLAKTITDAYEGVCSPNGVWFRNVRIQEIGRNGEFHETQVLADFTYYEQK